MPYNTLAARSYEWNDNVVLMRFRIADGMNESTFEAGLINVVKKVFPGSLRLASQCCVFRHAHQSKKSCPHVPYFVLQSHRSFQNALRIKAEMSAFLVKWHFLLKDPSPLKGPFLSPPHLLRFVAHSSPEKSLIAPLPC